MKIRIEICDAGDEEIIIRCREHDGRVAELERAVEGIFNSQRELALYIGNTEHYVPISEILFFQTDDGHVRAHTAERMYTVQYKLFELEDMLPSSFVRISKSSIVNVLRIASLSREIVGNGTVSFYKTEKKTFFSRAYYRILRDRIEEIRFSHRGIQI